MVNTRRLNILADVIEAAANRKEELVSEGEAFTVPKNLGFSMAVTYSANLENLPQVQDLTGRHCGTVGCFIGWTLEIWPEYKQADQYLGAVDALGVDEISRELFMPEYFYDHPDRYPVERCVAVLRYLAETGNVDWSIPYEK